MKQLLIAFTVFLLLPAFQGYTLPPYENCRIVDDALNFKFYWNTSTDGFYGAVEATNSNGYVALGVATSTTNSMTSNGAGSDAWIFYFSGGVPKSADGWMVSHDNPLTDTNHLQVLGGGVTSGSIKAVEFYRKYNTGDSMDRVIDPSQLVNFIYAVNTNSPVIVGVQEIEMEEHGLSRCGLVGIVLNAHSSCDPVASSGGPSFIAPDGTFRANWTLTSTDITFMMSGLGTGGYVAMGWNMAGGMPNADMVVGWIDTNNNVIVSDRWSANKNMPVTDVSNGGQDDITNTQGYVETYNGAQWTTIIFTRPLNSGDSSDVAIVNGPMHLLYAVGQSGSVNYGANTFQQHSSKGDVVVNFFDLNGTVIATPPPSTTTPIFTNATSSGNSYLSPDGTFKVNWVINDPNITFTMSGTTTTGWVGMGWNTNGGMPNTDMVVGWVDSTGAVVALDTWASKRNIPAVDTALGGDSYLFNVSGRIETVDGKKWTTISFTRPLQVTDKFDIAIADQQYHMLWAVGPDGSVNYATQVYDQHSSEGDVLVNFFSGNALCETAAKATNPYFKAHGILMIVGWTMMLYVGTYIARYMKPVTKLWFKVHVALQTIGCVAVIVAFVLVLIFYNGGFTVGWHQMVGLFVIIGTVSQPIIGGIADRMYDPKRSKIPVWPDQIHWWVGRGTSIVALAAIFLGIWVYMPDSLIAYVLFGVYCFLTFVIILVSELKIGVAHENEVYMDDMQIDKAKVQKRKVFHTRNLFWAWVVIGFLVVIALVIFIAIYGLTDKPVGC